MFRREFFQFAPLPFFGAKSQAMSGYSWLVNAADYPTLQAAVDAAFGPTSAPNGTNFNFKNKVLFIPPPTNGQRAWHINQPLQVKYLHGGRIIGAGRGVTEIVQDSTGLPVFETNGCGYSSFESMSLRTAIGGTCIDLSWDGSAGGPALQSNRFSDMSFFGGNYGVKIGAGGFMGSENLFQNCSFLLHAQAGIVCSNFNALQQSIIGGNFQGCGRAIWVGAGSVPVVHGVGFQVNSICDIQTDSSAYNTMSIQGCRSESKHFFINNGGQHFDLSACSHTGPDNGFFLHASGGQGMVSGCRSIYGQVFARYWAQVRIQNSKFNRADWVDAYPFWSEPFHRQTGCFEIENVIYDNDTKEIRKRRIVSPDNGGNWTTYDYVVQEII